MNPAMRQQQAFVAYTPTPTLDRWDQSIYRGGGGGGELLSLTIALVTTGITPQHRQLLNYRFIVRVGR